MTDSSVAPWRDRVSNALMLIVALGASFAFASATRAVTAASDATRAVEIWRMVGYFVFTVIFILLAMRPRRHPGLWELSFLHKAGVAAFLVAIAPTASPGIVAVDATLALVIGVCYFLTRGYLAWSVAEPTTAGAAESSASLVMPEPTR